MPLTNFPYGAASFGAPMTPAPWARPIGFGGAGFTTLQYPNPGPGSQVFFVNSALATAADSAPDHGLDPLTPFNTINFAVTRCIANNGDVIYVGPKHVETVSAAAGLTIGKAGVTIIGIGNANGDRPRINYTTSTAATVTITAAACWIQGMDILNSIDARVDGFIVSAADCRFVDCQFYDAVGASSLISIRTTAAGSRLKLYGVRCYFSENTGTARTEFLRVVGGTDIEIVGFYNNPAATYSTAVVNNVTTATKGFLISSSAMANGTTAAAASFPGTTTGLVILDSTFTSTGTTAITTPVFGSGGSFIFDGSSSTGTPNSSGSIAPGSPGVFQKSIVSSTIPQATAVVTAVQCSSGSVVIDGITAETDATGLAGGTNLQMLTNNVNGLTGTGAQLASETVANLGANKTVDLTAASVTALRIGFVLEQGKVLQLNSTAAACTSAGTIKLNVRYRILAGSPVLS